MQTLHLAEAVVTVQRAYRQRLGRKLMRAQRALMERHRQQTVAAQLMAAIKFQAIWRGFFFRVAMSDMVEDRAAHIYNPHSTVQCIPCTTDIEHRVCHTGSGSACRGGGPRPRANRRRRRPLLI